MVLAPNIHTHTCTSIIVRTFNRYNAFTSSLHVSSHNNGTPSPDPNTITQVTSLCKQVCVCHDVTWDRDYTEMRVGEHEVMMMHEFSGG